MRAATLERSQIERDRGWEKRISTTRVITPTMRERLRETSAPLIAQLRAEGKPRRWDEDAEKWQHD
jgi:hypothetical protein